MHKDQGGECLTIQGIKCYLPPVPRAGEIQNYGLPKKQQKWVRPTLPIFKASDVDIWSGEDFGPNDVITWDEASRQEHIKIYGTDPDDVDRQGNEKRIPGVEVDPDYQMDCLVPFREQELDRVQNGHWIYINGKPYYLTGNYYLYLAWWKLLDGYPEFRHTDLELMYFWESIRKCKNLFGVVYVTMRGVGKSYLAGCIEYYAATHARKASTTIQSISDDKAAEFFRDKILMPIQDLPNFLVPINKHGVADITSNSTFEMVPAARKGMPVRVYKALKAAALYSKMQYSNASDIGAEGGTWAVIVGDEFGKTPESNADVYNRTLLNHFTVFRGNKKLGNQFLTTTIEDIDVYGANCIKVWEGSNHHKMNEANSTTTGLARFFRSALDTTFFDDFGFSVPYTDDPETMAFLEDKYGPEAKHGSKPFHDAKRKALENDPSALIGYKQRNPYNEDEAFFINAKDCIYNAEILQAAKQNIKDAGKPLTRRGNIRWERTDEKAIWEDDSVTGRWECSFFNFEPNQVQINEGRIKTFTPKATSKRIIGIDPYAARDLADEDAGSNGAAVVYNRHDVNIPLEYCDTIIADYLFRPKDPFDFYEEMLAAAFFFGCPIFIEMNKSNMHDYCRTRGYKWGADANPKDFIWERPRSTFTSIKQKDTDGMYNLTGTIEHYTNSTANHITKHGHKLKHTRVIDQWLLFDPTKTKKFDLAVAASMAIVGAERKGFDAAPEIEMLSLIRTYDNSGQVSRRL